MKNKKNKRKNGLLIALFVAAILMAVGYAAYSSDLIINATGKILTDWDIKFTKIELDETVSTLKTNDGVTNPKGGAETKASDVTVISDGTTKNGGELVLAVNAGLVYFDDVVAYNIDITNWSTMFKAELIDIDIKYYSDSAGTTELTTPFIKWTTGILTERDTVTPADGTIINQDPSTDGSSADKVTFALKAQWDATLAAAGTIPTKDDGSGNMIYAPTMDWDTTYTEYAIITLTWEAVQP